MSNKPFSVGDRVIVKDHWEFPDGTTGTIAEPPEVFIELAEPGEWIGIIRTTKCRGGFMQMYYVIFNEPTNDGSGDGPYSGGEINAGALNLIE